MLPAEELGELWEAQYCVLKPPELLAVEVAITYCTLALLAAVVLPKWLAARTASAAICDCRGRLGADELLSYQTPAYMFAWLPAGVPAPLQNTVPVATPWQYWVTLFIQELPPTL